MSKTDRSILFIRGVPKDVLKNFKKFCIGNDLAMTDVVITFLKMISDKRTSIALEELLSESSKLHQQTAMNKMEQAETSLNRRKKSR